MSLYRIAGVEPPDPTEGAWLPREQIGVAGDGRPVYAAPRAYSLRWNLLSWEEWAALVGFFRALQSSGTVTVSLPAYPRLGLMTGGFAVYSGCVLSEPQVGPFFNETYPTDVVLVISNIIAE